MNASALTALLLVEILLLGFCAGIATERYLLADRADPLDCIAEADCPGMDTLASLQRFQADSGMVTRLVYFGPLPWQALVAL